MIKRLMALLLIVATLATMIVAPVNATQLTESERNNVTAPAEVCPCGCGQALADVTWQVWAPNGFTEVTSGHYYLTGDYVQAEQEQIISGDRIVLDLRGHTLTTETYSRLFLIYGYLAVIDTVGGGVFSAKTPGAYGGVVMVSTKRPTTPPSSCTAAPLCPTRTTKAPSVAA